jgi:hypothetical protein
VGRRVLGAKIHRVVTYFGHEALSVRSKRSMDEGNCTMSFGDR